MSTNNKLTNSFRSELNEFVTKFKKFDPKLKKNILIGSFMIFSVLLTGVLLAIIALVRFGGKIIDAKLALY